MRARPPRRLRKQRPWLAPLGYCLLAVALGVRGPALGTLLFGESVSRMSADSAIALLASVGSGMMALTGIVFSLVFVALQFGTTAYSPRLADELGRDRILPHGLGVFTGTFLYSVLAIRAVDLEGASGINLPAVLIAFVWLLGSVAVLTMLVPQIQALTITKVLYRVGREGRRESRRVYPPFGDARDETDLREIAGARVTQVIRHLGAPMHLLALDEPALVDLAQKADVVLRVPYAVGDPVLPGDPLALVLGGSVPEDQVRRAILVSRQRTLAHNPMYALRLLADIAIRGLSPALNDPTTAVMALDEIHGVLRVLGDSHLDIGRITDGTGRLRLVFSTPSWDDLLLLALWETAFYGRESVQVQRRLGSLLQDLNDRLPEPRRAAIDRLRQRQTALIHDMFAKDEARAEALALDRQGLGHAAERS